VEFTFDELLVLLGVFLEEGKEQSHGGNAHEGAVAFALFVVHQDLLEDLVESGGQVGGWSG